jgi:hypothetical protein
MILAAVEATRATRLEQGDVAAVALEGRGTASDTLATWDCEEVQRLRCAAATDITSQIAGLIDLLGLA